jgi:hypothetical protein
MTSNEAKMPGLSRRAAINAILAGGIVPASVAVAQTVDDYTRTVGGLTAYLGVMPAAIVKGQPPMHDRASGGPHEYHVVAAIFEAASATRVSDATVTAKVSGLGLSGSEKALEPMKIADTITYGGFFYLPGADLYTLTLVIRRPGSQQPVVMDFKFDHRAR